MKGEYEMKAKFSISLIIALLFLSTLSVCINIAPVPVYASAPNWNIIGTWAYVGIYGGNPYPHTMIIDTEDLTTGAITGHGHYNPDLSYTWILTGTVSGDDISFHIVYTGSNPGYYVDATGVIASSGSSMAGTWSNNYQSGTWSATGTAAQITQIDIKPGSFPNSVNLGDQGLLPVAILGSATLDVSQIDPSTILIGGVGLASRGSAKAPKLSYSIADVNGDGYPDMMLFFSIQALVAAGVLTSTTTSLTVTGYLYPAYGGTAISGTDSVNIVPP
jgi:hypothetical protein